jgi:hypothetical protein
LNDPGKPNFNPIHTMQTHTLHDVPKSKLKSTTEDFEDDGYTVTSQQQDNGKYTLVAVRPGQPVAAAAAGGNVVVFNNVKPAKLAELVQDLTDDGYTVTVQPEPDGEFTVIGVKNG